MLHDEGIALFWPGVEPVGKFDCINLGLLESSVKQPFQSAFGEDAYPTIYEKAACLFHSLIANHCFHNGNKRTGVLAMDQFLLANEHVLTLPNDDMYNLAKVTASYREGGVAPKEMFDVIAKTIALNMVPFKALRTAQPKFYLQCKEWTKFLRSHSLNRRGAIPAQARMQQGIRD